MSPDQAASEDRVATLVRYAMPYGVQTAERLRTIDKLRNTRDGLAMLEALFDLPVLDQLLATACGVAHESWQRTFEKYDLITAQWFDERKRLLKLGGAN